MENIIDNRANYNESLGFLSLVPTYEINLFSQEFV